MSLYEFTLQSPKELMIIFTLFGFIEATYRMATGTIQLSPDEKDSFEEFSKNDYITDKEEITK